MGSGNQNSVEERVKNSLEKMRPFLQADGGNVELVEISDENIVKIRLLGACKECPYRTQTLSALRESVFKAVPEIKNVLDVL